MDFKGEDALLIEKILRNPQTPLAVQFLMYRWYELLHPHGHFSRSANALLSPMTAIDEFITAARLYVDRVDGTKLGEVRARSRALRTSMDQESNLKKWFAAPRDALHAELILLENEDVHLQNPHTVIGDLLDGQVEALRQVLVHPKTGYRVQLVQSISDQILNTPQEEREWRRFDRDLAFLAAFLLGEGRGASALTKALLQHVRTAATAKEAATAFEALVRSPATSFVVAVGIEGISHIPAARSFGCRNRPRKWPNHIRAKNQLDGLQKKIKRRTGRGVLLYIDVASALDEEHAKAQALQVAERLADRLAGQYRKLNISPHSSALVFNPHSKTVNALSPRPVTIAEGAPLDIPPLVPLTRSLRFHGLSRQSESPVVSVLHNWIALECLASHAEDRMGKEQKATAFLPANLNGAISLVALTAQYDLLAETLSSLAVLHDKTSQWNQVQTWIEQRGTDRNSAWQELLGADFTTTSASRLLVTDDAVKACSFVHRFAKRLGVFAHHRFLELHRRLTNSSRLTQWLRGQHDLARANLNRMQFVRHSAVHRAHHDVPGAYQLAHAAQDIASASYTALSIWLGHKTYSDTEIWCAIRDLNRHHENRWDAWHALRGRPQIDPSQLLMP